MRKYWKQWKTGGCCWKQCGKEKSHNQPFFRLSGWFSALFEEFMEERSMRGNTKTRVYGWVQPSGWAEEKTIYYARLCIIIFKSSDDKEKTTYRANHTYKISLNYKLHCEIVHLRKEGLSETDVLYFIQTHKLLQTFKNCVHTKIIFTLFWHVQTIIQITKNMLNICTRYSYLRVFYENTLQ